MDFSEDLQNKIDLFGRMGRTDTATQQTPLRRSCSACGRCGNPPAPGPYGRCRSAPAKLMRPPPAAAIEARFVLQTEAFPPGLGQGALGCNDVGLELDGISTCIGCRVDAGMRHTQAAVMSLGDFGNDVTGSRVTWIVQPGIGHLDIGSIMGGELAKHSIPALRECLEQHTITCDNADLMIQPAGAGCPVAAAEQGPVLVAVLDQCKLVVHG